MTFQITVTPLRHSTTEEETEDNASLISTPDAVPKSALLKSTTDVHSAATSPAKSLAPQNLAVATKLVENAFSSPSTIPPSLTKEDDTETLPGMRLSPSLGDSDAVRGGRSNISIQIPPGIPLSHGGGGPSSGTQGRIPSPSDNTTRSILEIEGRIGNTSGQPPLPPLSNRMILQWAAKTNDVASEIDCNASEPVIITSRAFSPSTVSGIQWRRGTPFQNQNKTVCSLCNIFI